MQLWFHQKFHYAILQAIAIAIYLRYGKIPGQVCAYLFHAYLAITHRLYADWHSYLPLTLMICEWQIR